MVAGHPRQCVIDRVVGIERDTQLEDTLPLGEQPTVVELVAAEPGAECTERTPILRGLIDDPLPGLDHAGSHLVGELGVAVLE